LEELISGLEVEIEAGTQKSEFAVFVDGKQRFSRLEQMRYPEAEEIVQICTESS